MAQTLQKPANSRTPAASRQPATTANICACESPEAADSLLKEISDLDALEAKIGAECEAKCNAIRADYNAKLYLQIDGEEVSIADRRSALVSALEAFATANRLALLDTSGKKSVDLNHGTIGWRQQPGRLEPVDGLPNAGNPKILDKIHEALCATLKGLHMLGLGLGLASFIKCQISWNRKALLDGLENKQFSKADLKRIGFVAIEGDDKFYASPKKQDLSSHPARREEASP